MAPELKSSIESIRARSSLTSRLEWTNEFVVVLRDGSTGVATSPQGDTLSRYETPPDRSNGLLGESVAGAVFQDLRKASHQREFDADLRKHRELLGHDNSYALSLAHFNAIRFSAQRPGPALIRDIYGLGGANGVVFPALLFNVLNGGMHAYTHPVLSDFCEYLLVPKFQDIRRQLDCFRKVEPLVSEILASLSRVKVGDNWVHCTNLRDNRVWLDLLMDVLHQLGLRDHFNLMIDASAGHLRHADRYVLSITDESSYTSEEFLEYWSDLLREYPIAILEDPFSEDDFASWQGLSSAFPDRVVASDNLCAADSARVIDAAHQGCMSAVIIKPSQAGTVSDAVSVFQTCLKNGLVPIPSHRSIDTADEFLSDLCCVFGVSRVKLGLLSDFDTVSRLNALIRNFEQAGS